MSIEITVNGDPRQAPQGQTLLELVESLGLDPRRVAVEFNRGILKQPEWSATVLQQGSEVEIVQFVGGG